MSKKKAPTKPEKVSKPNESKAGAGRKLCPGCEKKGSVNRYVVGPATSECPECGHKFEVAKKGAKSKSSAPDLEKKAMEFVLFNQAGNLDKALKAVEGYSEDALARFIADCGGAEKAKELLEQLAAKQGAK